MIKYTHSDGKIYHCIPSKKRRYCDKYFAALMEQRWENFDEWFQQIHLIRYVIFNKKDWIKSQCSFSFWNKKHFCHHIIGLAVLKKKCNYKDVHKQIPIGQTRPRGKPKKTSSALTRQLDKQETSDSSDSSDSDSEAELGITRETRLVKATGQVKRKAAEPQKNP